MKTKLLLCVLILSSCYGNVFSQEYHPLLNNTTWVVTRTVSCCTPMRVQVIAPQAEVVIGDYTYTAYPNPFPGSDSNVEPTSTIYVREDIAERKVYKLADGVETLLFDYSLETGDTVTRDGYTWTATVDEIETNAGLRKRITLLAPFNTGHNVKQIWIEGVGTNKHPFYPTHNMYSFMSASGGIMISTACVYQNGAHTFGDADCTSLLSTTSEVLSNEEIVFSPNPVTANFTISSEAAFRNATFKLYNIQGQLVKELNNLSGKTVTVNRQNLNTGLYFAQLSEDGQVLKTSKLILE